MTDAEREAEIRAAAALIDDHPNTAMVFLLRRLDEVRVAHDARVTELLEYNNAEIELRRGLERQMQIIAEQIAIYERRRD